MVRLSRDIFSKWTLGSRVGKIRERRREVKLRVFASTVGMRKKRRMRMRVMTALPM